MVSPARHVDFLLRGAWNGEFLEECEAFSPDEREYEHDDQVDAACGAFNYLAANRQEYAYTPVRRPDRLWASSRDEEDPFADAPRRQRGLGGLIKGRRFGPGAW